MITKHTFSDIAEEIDILTDRHCDRVCYDKSFKGKLNLY